jgi:myo-inositol-1-phosphate synthase
MTTRVKVAIAGIGNNVSALVQGVYYYRALKTRQPDASLPGIRRPVIDGLGVDDVEFVAGFDVAESKVGKHVSAAIFAKPNSYPRLDVEVPTPLLTWSRATLNSWIALLLQRSRC